MTDLADANEVELAEIKLNNKDKGKKSVSASVSALSFYSEKEEESHSRSDDCNDCNGSRSKSNTKHQHIEHANFSLDIRTVPTDYNESTTNINNINNMNRFGSTLPSTLKIDIDIVPTSPNMQSLILQSQSFASPKSDRSRPSATSVVSTPIESPDDDDNSDDDHGKIKQTKLDVMSQHKSVKNKNVHKNKWVALVTNLLFWIRIFILILSVFLFILSASYCVAQLIEAKLDLETEHECKPKTREEIWEHSYRASEKYPDDPINEETQFGYTNDTCWTTKRIQFTDELWYYNKYIPSWSWDENNINAKFVCFGIVTIYCLLIILYNIITLIIDIIHVANNKLHTKSSAYQSYINQQRQNQLQSVAALNMNNKPNPNQKQEPRFQRKWNDFKSKFKKIYFTYFTSDTTGWILMRLSGEIIEIIIQSQALWLYNGYHVFDPDHEDNTYLAKKPQSIIIFAGLLSFNCFGSGILWFCYSSFPKQCRGLRFERALFFVDKFSDFVYISFPFMTLYLDKYNQTNTNIIEQILVLSGQLNINSTLAFSATFIPLFFLINRCAVIIITSRSKMRKKQFLRWKVQNVLSQQTDDNEAIKKAISAGYDIDIRHNNGEIFDGDGNMILPMNSIIYDIKNWIDKTNDGLKAPICKRTLLIFISLCFMGWGVFILSYIIIKIQSSEVYCNSVTESNWYYPDGTIKESNWDYFNGTFKNISSEQLEILQTNPELFLWDKCLYKVYPFYHNDNFKQQCQCRVFVIDDWRDNAMTSSVYDRKEYFNLTQQKILTGILENWYMLEKFRTLYGEDGFLTQYKITTSMINAVYLRAFEWKYTNLILPEKGISKWENLQYLKLEEINGITNLPNDFRNLTNLKQLSLINISSLHNFSKQICDLIQLEILQFQWIKIESIPHCLSNLALLKQLLIDGTTDLYQIPISIFGLQNLIDLSLFDADINYIELLNYNNITGNDSDIDEWFTYNFKWNQDGTDYWLQLNPICDDNETYMMPSTLQEFMNNTAHCTYQCGNDNKGVCLPMRYGDGICDERCSIPECEFDGGDCIQLCFAKKYSNCTYELLTNNTVCDKECNNAYCAGYSMESFENATVNPDLGHCNSTDSE